MLRAENVKTDINQFSSICRGCLATERRMMKTSSFEDMFKDLTGIIISSTDGLPQWLCYECSALLQKCCKFRTKILKSHYKLCQYVLGSVPCPESYCAINATPAAALAPSATAAAEQLIYTLQDEYRDGAQQLQSSQHQLIGVTATDAASAMADVVMIPQYGSRHHNATTRLLTIKIPGWDRYRSPLLYTLSLIQFDLDVDATPHLNRSIVLHCHIASSQDNKLQKPSTNKCESDVPAGIIGTESVQVKDEPISSDREDNIAEEECSAYYDEPSQYVLSKLPIDVMSAETLKFEAEIEQEEQEDQTRKVEEPLYRGYKREIALEQCRKDSPQFQLASSLPISDPLDINSAVTLKHEEQAEEVKASSQEPHVGAESAQQHLHKHVGASRTWRHDKERKHPADITSMRHSDDTEEEVKHNIHRDDSVNISSYSVQSYICDTCNKCFSDKDHVITHIREHSAEKSFKCDVCYKHFSDDSTLTKHSRVHTAAKLYQCGDKPYKCDVCMKRFSRKSHFVRHMRIHTGEMPYKCDVCMKCFGSKSDLIRHMPMHTGDKPYTCDVCMKCFGQKGNLIKHMRLHTGDKPYKCDVCMKCFANKSNFNNHIRLHTGDKPYKCDVCMKCFGLKCNLNSHMRRHTVDKPYKCDVCMKCFGLKSNLNKHMQLHTGDKPYKCDVCMKCIAYKSNLNKHMRLHTGDKPYKCDVCMKCFTFQSSLTTHTRLHTGDKPYKCDVCMKCFTQKGSLNMHMRMHTGDKPYMCNVCMKCFAQKGHLNRHMRLHTGDKPYMCVYV